MNGKTPNGERLKVNGKNGVKKRRGRKGEEKNK
jgi:hypothetical protein